MYVSQREINCADFKEECSQKGIRMTSFESLMDFSEFKLNSDGLLPVVTQHYKTSEVLKMCIRDRVMEALRIADRMDLVGFDEKCLIRPRKLHSEKMQEKNGYSGRNHGGTHGGTDRKSKNPNGNNKNPGKPNGNYKNSNAGHKNTKPASCLLYTSRCV